MAPVVREKAIEAKSTRRLREIQHGRNARQALSGISATKHREEDMILQPLLEASPAIQIHAYAATLAFLLGGAILFRRKGDRTHRMGGRVWAVLMLAVRLSSFFIHTIRLWGPWSPIHLVSIGTLFALGYGIRLIRRRNVVAHQRTMQATYLGALIVAGIFTFLPGRIMNEVFFGGPQPMAGVAVVTGVAVAGAALVWMRLRKPTPLHVPNARSRARWQALSSATRQSPSTGASAGRSHPHRKDERGRGRTPARHCRPL